MDWRSWGTLVRRPCILTTMRWYVLTVVVYTVYLYLNLFASPRFPFLLGGDQVYFWMGAQQLLNGRIIYRDFFQFTPPGTDLVFAGFFKALGPSIWVPNVVVIALGTLSACVCFSVARQIMRDMQAALTTGLFMVLIYGKALNATHHWFAVLVVLVAVRVNMKQVTEMSIALSGALLGLAAFFNQAHGAAALVGFAAFLLVWSIRTNIAPVGAVKIVAVLLLALALVLLCLSAYYIATAGIQQFWYCLVLSVFKHYVVEDSQRTLVLPGMATPRSIPTMLPYLAVFILLPVIYGFSLWQCWRSRRNASFRGNQITLLSLVGLGLLLEVATSVNWLRLFAVSLPGIILTGWAIGGLRFHSRALFIATSIILTSIAVHQIVAKHALANSRGELPAGRLSTTPRMFEKLSWLAAHTHRGEFFLQAGWPGVYLPLQVQNPLYSPTLAGLDDAQNIESALQQMKARRVRYVLWTPDLDKGCELMPCQDRLSPFRAYLNSSYRLIHTFQDGDILWQKADDAASFNSESKAAYR